MAPLVGFFMAAFSFQEQPDDSIGLEKPPLDFQQIKRLRHPGDPAL